MRLASWVFVLCAALGAIALFLPSLEVEVKGQVIKQTKLSLYAASTKREMVAKIFAKYRKLPGRGVGVAIANALVPKLGRAGEYVDDVASAADTLNGVTDEDIGMGGKALVALVWVMLGLHVGSLLLVAGEQMRETGGVRGKRIAVAVVMGVLVSAIAIGVNIACRAAVFEANDDIGVLAFLELGSGQTLMLGAAIGGAASILAVAVLAIRGRRRGGGGVSPAAPSTAIA